MPSQKYANLAQSTLASSYTAGNTSLTVQTGDGALFPSAGNFVLAIDDPPAFFLECTARSGDNFTVGASAIEGTTASGKSTGIKVTQVISAGALDGIRSDISQVGAFASLPGSGMKAGDRYSCTNSPYSFIYDGSNWQAFAYGVPVTLPPTGSWTWANQGSGTATDNVGTIYLNLPTASGDAIRAYLRSAGGTFDYRVAFFADYNANLTAASSGLGLMVGDGTKYIHFEFASFDSQAATPRLVLQKWNTTSSASSGYNNSEEVTAIAYMGKLIWMRLVLDATNLTWYYSIDGFTWTQFDQRTKGDFLGTITQVGVGGYVNTTCAMSLISSSGA